MRFLILGLRVYILCWVLFVILLIKFVVGFVIYFYGLGFKMKDIYLYVFLGNLF